MILLLVVVPAAAALIAFFIRADRVRRALLVLTAALHTALVAWCWADRASFTAMGAWVGLDATGLLFLTVTNVLFLAVSVYTVGFLRRESDGTHADREEGFLFSNAPEAVFTACLLLFLSTMSLVTISRHFTLMWVAIEATTLVTAPLIHYHRHHRSLEAAWKYLLICSVGIAIALLGSFFLAAAASGGEPVPLTFDALLASAGSLDTSWLKAAFILFLVGYGTKMGLVPMHTWLPDAHSEAPSPVSALLSGALLNCAFLAILRIHAVCVAAGIGPFSRELLLIFGLVSMGGAAAFIIGQPDFKRLLAYSSVENMGILAIGVGLGGLGNWGALFHAMNHSLAKAALFLTAGNILAACGTKKVAEIRGLLSTQPWSAGLWIAGFFAIGGAPPFGAFLSEFTVLRAAVSSGSWLVVTLYLLLLTAVFIGMAAAVTGMTQGAPPEMDRPRIREPLSSLIAPIALLTMVAALGLVMPPFLDDVLREAALLLGGST